MNDNEALPRRRRRPIGLSLFFAACAGGYALYLVALVIILAPMSDIGRAFGGMSHAHSFDALGALLSLCYVFAPLLYFISSYLCCRPQTTGIHLRRVFVASVAFLLLAVIGFAFATPVDPFSSRTRIVISAALMATPFLFATACLFYARWGPPSHSTNVA